MISSAAAFTGPPSEPHFLRHPPSLSPVSGPCNLSFASQSTFIISPRSGGPAISCFSASGTSTSTRSPGDPAPPVKMKRKRFRKQYPGESKGITEEMRFVAMRLRNDNGKKSGTGSDSEADSGEESRSSRGDNDTDAGANGEANSWQPSIKGFLMYLVDSKLVFNTIEKIVDESDDVSYAYFRRTGLERSQRLSMDIEWLREKNYAIPEPHTPGVSYAKHLEELAKESAPVFLCHFYNIYFSHIAGGQVIVRKVSQKLLDERELEFCKWDGDVQESLKGVRDKLNLLGEHWSRDDKNKCLRETSKSFKFLGNIVRLITV